MAIGGETALSTRLFPPGLKPWLARRARQLAGGAALLLAAWLALALAGHDAGDPSFSRATGAMVANPAGAAGAAASGLLFAWLGLAAWLAPLLAAGWGRRLLSGSGVPLAPWRAAAALAAPAPLTVALTLAGGGSAGGIAGLLLASALAGATGATVGGVWLAPLLALAGLAAFVFAAALLPGDAVFVARLARRAGAGLAALWRRERRRPAAAPTPALPAEAPVAAGEEKRAAPAQKRPRRRRAAPAPAAEAPAPDAAFALPSQALLAGADPRQRRQASAEDLKNNARMLEGVLADFRVQGRIVDVRPGPVVTLYELEPEANIRASRVIGLADDIARRMSALSARVAVVPGRTVLGIELPNADRETVVLRELLETGDFADKGLRLPIALGKRISGAPAIEDLADMPHLLVAGTTGSGKSVAVNAMILSLLYRMTPEECRLILIDPKMLELSVYDDIPHLLAPVVTEPGKAVMALKWAVREMERRYRAMQKVGVRNIDGFNRRVGEALAAGGPLRRRVQTGFDGESGEAVFEEETVAEAPLPYIVVVVDEMADLMLVAGRDIEGAIQRLAQMARAAGIHLVMATQRPSVDVITGTIKANFPSRISFHVTSKIDSRTIIGEMGAEQLLGRGDMLFMRGGGRLTRIHGPFVGDDEVQRVAEFLRRQGAPDYVAAVTEEAPEAAADEAGAGGGDPAADDKEQTLYDRAVFLVTGERKASTSFVQRHLKIGYNRAATLIERMERAGVVGPANHVGKREVLAPPPPEL